VPSTLAVVTDPAAVVAVCGVGVAYAAGVVRWRRQAHRRVVGPGTATAFGCGLVVVVIALASPLDAIADRSLSAHMTQHVLLLAAAGPLLALGAPTPTLFWALPDGSRQAALAWYRRALRLHARIFPVWVAAVLLVEAAIMWSWHIPAVYQAALRDPWLHALEHGSFLAASVAAWWSVANGRRSHRGAAAIAGLFGSLPGIALGSAMVLAPNPWYPVYVTSTRAAALVDQQVAGVIMWAFGGMAAVIAGAGLFASWLRNGAAEPAQYVPSRRLAVPTPVWDARR